MYRLEVALARIESEEVAGGHGGAQVAALALVVGLQPQTEAQTT